MPRYQRSAELMRAAKTLSAAGDERGSQELTWEKMAFDFMAVPWWSRSRGAARFEPLVQLTDGRAYPVLEAISPEVCPHWRSRAETSQNPAVRARLFDLLWEKERRYPDALQAFDAYVALGDAHLRVGQPDSDFDAVEALARALHIATLLNDQERVHACAQKCVEDAEALLASGSGAAAHTLVEALLLSEPACDAVDLQHLGDLCDRGACANRPEDGPPGILNRHWLETMRKVALARKDQNGARGAQIRIAQSFEAEAEFHRGRSELVRSTFLQDAITAYQQAGACDREVRALLAEHAAALNRGTSEMKEIRGSVTIPGEAVRKWEEQIRQAARQHGLAALAAELWLPPGPDALREEAEESAQQFVLGRLFPCVQQEEKHVVARAATMEENLRLDVISRASLHLQFQCQGVVLALDTLREEQNLGPAEVASFLGQSNLFEPCRLQLIERGAVLRRRLCVGNSYPGSPDRGNSARYRGTHRFASGQDKAGRDHGTPATGRPAERAKTGRGPRRARGLHDACRLD